MDMITVQPLGLMKIFLTDCEDKKIKAACIELICMVVLIRI